MSGDGKLEKYVVVGFGWVGQANAIALKLMGHDVSIFDPATPPRHYEKYASVYESIPRLSEVNGNDGEHTWYIVCVGDRVSEAGEQDISNIKSALSSLAGLKGKVILRSTVLPDLLKDLPFDYYLPEFLHEVKAVEECIEPYFFVIGSTTTKEEPSVFRIWRRRAHKVFKGNAREAAFVKYLSNVWNSVQVAFTNEFGDAIGRPKESGQLREIEHVIDFIFERQSYRRYGRAFGGHCLPKDTRAFRAWFEKQGKSLPLISGAYESNLAHAQLEKELPLLPEWYSEWPDQHISGWDALRELGYSIRKHLKDPRLFFGKRRSTGKI